MQFVTATHETARTHKGSKCADTDVLLSLWYADGGKEWDNSFDKHSEPRNSLLQPKSLGQLGSPLAEDDASPLL